MQSHHVSRIYEPVPVDSCVYLATNDADRWTNPADNAEFDGRVKKLV
jgi:hypothetical protein